MVNVKLSGERIILTKGEKNFDLAYKHIAEVKASLAELAPWLDWATSSYKVEDSYEYLLHCDEQWNNAKEYNYIIEDYKGNFMGTISALNIVPTSKCAEIGYWLSTKYTGKGYMQEAVKLLEKELFKEGFNRIVIQTDVLNLKSAGVAQKTGYILEGVQRQKIWSDTQKRYRDINLFSKLKEDYEKNL